MLGLLSRPLHFLDKGSTPISCRASKKRNGLVPDLVKAEDVIVVAAIDHEFSPQP